jgi:hypothetical protein
LKIFFYIILFTLPIFAQISPGDLTKVHADLEGISNCTKCHELGKKVSNSLCLNCHYEIKNLINTGKGYHSNSEVRNKQCASCHNEHHGRNFRIINFDQNKFDHNKTGFQLTGKHLQAKCNDCHKAKFILDSKLKKKANTYLGLDEKCISCHEDYHKNTLGKDCASCHNTESFLKVEKFDHSKAAFKLSGAHEKVECSKCHPKEVKDGKEVIKLKGIAFSNCSSCHADAHKGTFGADCKSCHTVNSFHIINQKGFDHSKTKFPLIGKHQIVKCNDCHKGAHKNKPLFTKCIDCHTDYHKGDFVQNGLLKDCKNCHNEEGFSPSLFTIEDHNKSTFKLDGSHLAVTCKKCHYKMDHWQFKKIGTDCQNCHQNVHGNEIKEKYFPGNKCETCHQTSNWQTISFDHNSTEFVLLGKHQKVKCSSCHYPEVNDKKVFLFASLKSNCVECHKDIHFGQFISEGINKCQNCHAFENWKPVKFDHSKAQFSTEGAHKKLDCSKCHKKVSENGNTFTLYKLKDFKCATCHSK